MYPIEKNILFSVLQIAKGNNSKKLKQSLSNFLIAFKRTPDDNEFDATFNHLFDNKNVNNYYISPNLFPKTIQSIANRAEIRYADDIALELRWQLKLFSKYSSVLNDFSIMKDNIEELILEEQYSDALDILKIIEQKYGVSIWLLEIKILLYQKLQMNVDNDVLHSAGSSFIAFLLHYYRMKTSSEISARDYEYIVNRFLSTYKHKYPDNAEQLEIIDYFLDPLEFKMSTHSIDSLLKYIYRLPLIDRFITILDVIEYYAAKTPEESMPSWLAKSIKYLESIDNKRAIALCFVFEDIETKSKRIPIEDQFIHLRNMFISGELTQCYSGVKNRIQTESTDIRLFIFYIELCHLLGYEVNNIDISESKLNLIVDLEKIYNISSDYKDAIDNVYKMCYMCFHAQWSRDVVNHITRRVHSFESDEHKKAIKKSNLQELTLHTVIENLSEESSLSLLKSTSFNNDDAYRLYCISILERDYKDASDKCKVKPFAEFLKTRDDNSFNSYNNYLNNDNPLTYKVECTKYLWSSMHTSSEYEQGIDIFIHLFISKQEYVMLAPINSFIDYAKRCDSNSRKHLRISILYYIYTTYISSTSKDDLSIACEDFLFLNDIDRPSKIVDHNYEQYDKTQLIFFLREICTPQIMGPVLLSIRTTKELEQERILVCQNLRMLDPDNESIYDQEIKDITHRLFINEGIRTLESQKIQVNTEGIKVRLSKELKSLFNKYKYSRDLQNESIIDFIKSIYGDDTVAKIIDLEPSQIFDELVTTIRNEFVLGAEYGLDASLSLNIRHGMLAGQLRAPLASKKLLAEKDAITGNYHIDEQWLDKIRNDSEKTVVKKAIEEFTKETDDIINYLKTELIQISTEEKPSNGIFRYHLSPSSINYFQNKVDDNSTFEDFIDIVFNELWQVTEHNLRNMQSVIREDIKARYINAFGKLQSTYANLSINFYEAEQMIKEAQNDMDAQLERLCDWFKRSSDGQYPDFDLDSAFQVGLQTIKNIHPTTKFKYEFKDNELTKKLKGSSWKSVVSIFHILFDNVSKYADETNGVKKIICTLKSTENNLYIRMENKIDSRSDLENAERKVNDAMVLISDAAYLDLVKQEGGSGIPKIYKIMGIDMKLRSNVNCRITDDKSRFIVEIQGDYN